jgi:hypothetical protein
MKITIENDPQKLRNKFQLYYFWSNILFNLSVVKISLQTFGQQFIAIEKELSIYKTIKAYKSKHNIFLSN